LRENCGAKGLHPTLRKSAKDGAPELLGLVESGSVGYPAYLTKGLLCDTTSSRTIGVMGLLLFVAGGEFLNQFLSYVR
jgi:hypothetical protein